MDENHSFYTETVRNETVKIKKQDSIKKMAIVSITASALCGVFIGFGIGIGIPIADKVIIPMVIEKRNPVETAVPSYDDYNDVEEEVNGFKFKEPEISDVTSITSAEGFGDIIQMAEPSVVAITVQTSYGYGSSSQQVGSGIIFHESQERVFIVTSYHVIQNAEGIQVSVEGKDTVTALVVGADTQSDLAVISVNKGDLKSLGIDTINLSAFGDSSKVRVGDFVLAIGNALGGGNTATFGMVSVKDKEVVIGEKPLSVIQTDVAINNGNSGGPLINTRGEVIGINMAKQVLSSTSPYSSSAVEGMSYSININTAKPIIESLMNQKPKPFLGIEGEDLSSETIDESGKIDFGVIIRSVISGSSAEKAGIKKSDVITSFNGIPIFSMDILAEAIAECQVGDSIEVRIARNGKPLTITVTLSSYN